MNSPDTQSSMAPTTQTQPTSTVQPPLKKLGRPPRTQVPMPDFDAASLALRSIRYNAGSIKGGRPSGIVVALSCEVTENGTVFRSYIIPGTSYSGPDSKDIEPFCYGIDSIINLPEITNCMVETTHNLENPNPKDRTTGNDPTLFAATEVISIAREAHDTVTKRFKATGGTQFNPVYVGFKQRCDEELTDPSQHPGSNSSNSEYHRLKRPPWAKANLPRLAASGYVRPKTKRNVWFQNPDTGGNAEPSYVLIQHGTETAPSQIPEYRGKPLEDFIKGNQELPMSKMSKKHRVDPNSDQTSEIRWMEGYQPPAQPALDQASPASLFWSVPQASSKRVAQSHFPSVETDDLYAPSFEPTLPRASHVAQSPPPPSLTAALTPYPGSQLSGRGTIQDHRLRPRPPRKRPAHDSDIARHHHLDSGDYDGLPSSMQESDHLFRESQGPDSGPAYPSAVIPSAHPSGYRGSSFIRPPSVPVSDHSAPSGVGINYMENNTVTQQIDHFAQDPRFRVSQGDMLSQHGSILQTGRREDEYNQGTYAVDAMSQDYNPSNSQYNPGYLAPPTVEQSAFTPLVAEDGAKTRYPKATNAGTSYRVVDPGTIGQDPSFTRTMPSAPLPHERPILPLNESWADSSSYPAPTNVQQPVPPAMTITGPPAGITGLPPLLNQFGPSGDPGGASARRRILGPRKPKAPPDAPDEMP